jgi:integral membrane sensor domain MASE1
MTTKHAVIATTAILFGAIVVGLTVLFLFIDLSDPDASERIDRLGSGFGMLCLFPLGVIWIKWAARFRKEREKEKSLRSTRR